MIIYAKDIKCGDVIITPVYIHGMEVKYVDDCGEKVRVRYVSNRFEYFEKTRLITRTD